MFHIPGRFDTTEEQADLFAEAYGPAGGWVRFFEGAEGYRGTELFRRTVSPPCFLTPDRRETRVAYEAFRRERATEDDDRGEADADQDHRAGGEYAALDAACEGLTLHERFLAAWEG